MGQDFPGEDQGNTQQWNVNLMLSEDLFRNPLHFGCFMKMFTKML